MTFLKIAFNSLATAALAAFVAGCLSFLHALVTKPNMEAVGQGIMQAVGAGIVAGLAGLILGIVGSLLFPAAYTKVMVVSLFIVVGLGMLASR